MVINFYLFIPVEGIVLLINLTCEVKTILDVDDFHRIGWPFLLKTLIDNILMSAIQIKLHASVILLQILCLAKHVFALGICSLYLAFWLLALNRVILSRLHYYPFGIKHGGIIVKIQLFKNLFWAVLKESAVVRYNLIHADKKVLSLLE